VRHTIYLQGNKRLLMFGTALNLFRVGETQVRVHPTFFLLLLLIGILQGASGGLAAGLYGVVFISILFLCVLLHEFGHVLAARRYGIRTRDVTLWPFGGIASLERMPEKPSQEIIVALAGPAVNVAIAIILSLVLGATVDINQLAGLERLQGSLLAQVAAANVALVLFNLIPAFPMDGGRVLRAVLAWRLGFPRATRIAASIGQAIAIVMGIVGLFGNPMLVLVAIFIFLAASGESGYVQARDLTRGHLARDAMITSFESLGVTSTVDDAAKLLLSTTQQEFPVVDGAGRLRGMVTRDGIVKSLGTSGGRTPVLEMMETEIQMVLPGASLDRVFEEMQRGKGGQIAVAEAAGAPLLGYITRENITELMMIREARAKL
jgi:Zn-dependent protease/CBS domain-containing protein